MDKTIKPINCLRGEIDLPGDKSISHRVIFIGSIAKGKTEGKNFLRAEDCLHTVSAFRAMGVRINLNGTKIIVSGKGLRGLRKPAAGKLYLGNSGTTMRILPGVLAGQDFAATLTGDASLSKRPMERIMEPLRKMGVEISSKKAKGFPPLIIKGGEVKPVTYSTKVASAQVKSCVLFAALYASGITSVTEPFVSRDHTERMLKFAGAKISRTPLTVSVRGGGELRGRNFFIPGDISSAAFFIAGACLLEGSDLTIRNVGLNPTRLGFLNALSRMGARITITGKKNAVEPYGTLRVRSAPLESTVVKKEEFARLIDEVPILSVLASRARGETVIKGISELRVKETDRIFSMTENLKRLGVNIKTRGEDLIIRGCGKRFNKAVLNSFKDHRTAMSMAIAALGAEGECKILDTACVNTSFPDFFRLLGYLKSKK
jgi:3-phosphoshikimate 1-carboxyvinyltransferase